MDSPVGSFNPPLPEVVRDRPVLVFANDWHTDPTSKHHVARTLSMATDVVWVEASGMRRPNLADVGDLKRIWSKLRGGGKTQATKAPPPVEVVSPLILPLPGFSPAEWINGVTYRRKLGAVLRRLGINKTPLLWVFIPTTEPYLDHVPHDGLIYHCVDRWWEFSEYDATVMRRCHERLCRRADVVFASAQELVEDCRDFTDKVHLVRHGVDWDHFSPAAFGQIQRPVELARVQGPVIGFFGLIHDWIDLDLIGAVADAFPHATLVLIGKTRVDTKVLEKRENVLMLGQRPYADLPAFSAHFDVALIPFVVNELTAAVNPIKLREYLSAGLPVVSTALPEILVYAEWPSVSVAHDRVQFVQAVGRAIAEPADRGLRQAVSRSMVEESWQAKTAEMLRLWADSRRLV